MAISCFRFKATHRRRVKKRSSVSIDLSQTGFSNVYCYRAAIPFNHDSFTVQTRNRGARVGERVALLGAIDYPRCRCIEFSYKLRLLYRPIADL